MIGIGIVKKIEDKERLIIRLDSLTGGKNIQAYPLDVKSVPEEGDYVVFVGLSDGVGQSFLYYSLRSNTETLTIDLKSGNNIVSVSNDKVTISSGSRYKVEVDESGIHLSGVSPMKSCGLQLLPTIESPITAPPSGGPCTIGSGVYVCPSTSKIDFE